MRAAVDNDAILKLAAFDLLGDGLALLGLVPADCVVLPSARNQLAKFSQRFAADEPTVARISAFLAEASALGNDAFDIDDQMAMQDVQRLDAGEILLISWA